MKKIKNKYITAIILVILLIACIILGTFLYKKNKEYTITVENQYNFAFYEVIDYVQNVENYLAKAIISSTPESGAETLTNVWREANLAQVYLAQLPSANSEFTNAAKFLNQVSDYSYSLSRKNINNEALSQEDLDNLKELHDYSKELKNILNQLSTDMRRRKNKLERINKRFRYGFCTTS